MISLPYIAASAAALAGLSAIGAWWVTREYYIDQHIAYVASQRAAEVDALRRHTDEVMRLQERNHALATGLEAQHGADQNALDKALADNQRLARKLGGLRDPGGRSTNHCPVSTAAPAAGQPADATAENRLSTEASEFLLEFARDADAAASYAGICHQWVEGLDGASRQE